MQIRTIIQHCQLLFSFLQPTKIENATAKATTTLTGEINFMVFIVVFFNNYTFYDHWLFRTFPSLFCEQI